MYKLLNTFNGYVSIWNKILLGVGSIAALMVMVLTTADVVGRNLFNSSISGVSELVSLLLLPIFMCSISFIQSQKSHVMLEFATEKAGAVAKMILELLGIGIGLFLFISIMNVGFSNFLSSYVANEVSSGMVKIPIWPFKLFLFISIITLVVQLGLDFMLDICKMGKEKEAQDD